MSILGPNPFRPPTAAELFAPLSSRLGLTTLEIHASPLWGSTNADHRTLLHAAVKARIEELGCVITQSSPYPVSAPADLSQASKDIPRSISISVSHTADVGGFALLSSHEGTIGFDIERLDRVSTTVAKRISSAGKLPTGVPDALFWAAKEAAFKALRGPRQPTVLSEVLLGKWNAVMTGAPLLETTSHFFEAKKNLADQGLGLTLAEKTHALSIFIVQPST